MVWGPDEHRIAYGKLRKKYLAAVLKTMSHWEERTPKGTIRKYPAGPTPPDNLPVENIVYPVYETTDIGKPRWFLEEWWAPELVVPDWENQRYDWVGGIREDVLGPAPIEGLYKPFRCIQSEDGKYREPNESDLEAVKALLRERDQEKKKHGNREVQFDREAIAELAGKYSTQIQQKEDALADNLEERLKESIRPHLDKLVKNPGKFW